MQSAARANCEICFLALSAPGRRNRDTAVVRCQAAKRFVPPPVPGLQAAQLQCKLVMSRPVRLLLKTRWHSDGSSVKPAFRRWENSSVVARTESVHVHERVHEIEN
ncbi:hypothetical protein BaRGS_00018559 [Batillaria attramentaria]|uniref:Uncharacterized protein n=1 Tax=Batillaria attramentaria TaxID=370345 RepID=A0ABD0KSM1_9CAEN